MKSSCLAVWFFALTVFSTVLVGQELKPGRLPSDVRKSLIPGLLTEYLSAEGKLLDSGVARLPAISLNEGEPVTPFVSTRNIKIRFSGFLKLKLKGAYQFSWMGNGQVEFRVNDKKVLSEQGDLSKIPAATVDLVKGYNRFEVVYSPPQSGVAKLRVYWENESFEKEPVPSIAFLNSVEENCLEKSKPLAKQIRKMEKVHHGRDLVMQHNCLKCHRSETVNTLYDQRDTPDLKIAASRLNKTWLEDWLANPAKLRNSTTMPSLMDSTDKQSIADLTAFVLSLAEKSNTTEVKGDVTKGGDTFENVGCIGCHHFEAIDFEDEYDRISLFYTAAKFKSGSLSQFLKNSRAHYKWSRMPQFRLTDTQCQNLEVYIRSESKGQAKGMDIPESNVDNGKKLFGNAGCANCHEVESVTDKLTDGIKPFGQMQFGKGCMEQDGQRNGNVPRYDLDEDEVNSINQFLDSGSGRSFAEINRSYFTARSIKEMRCTTCHDLDDEQASLPYIIEEEGVVGLAPNRVPMLTYAGEKLLPNWSVDLIAGELAYRVREHFRVQMPGFPARGPMIAHGLSTIHGFESNENASVNLDAESVKKGQAVAAMETGLSCNRCHAIADKKPNAAFDAQSTNLVYAAKRLRKEYYMRWMFDPIRIDKQTKMPRFSEDRKSTSLKTVFEGDSRKQFEALWQYLNKIKAD